MKWKICSAYSHKRASALAAMAAVALTGCGVQKSTPSTNYNSPITLQGQVFAGRNYMAGATVNVYATQPNGVASNGSYTGTAKLLSTTTANGTGGWSITGLSCSSPDQLYVTATGGVPYPSGQNSTALPNNPNSLMMTAIGDCSILTSATATTNVTTIVTNEASTVAAVWALRNFISLSGTSVNVTSSATNYGGLNGIGTPASFAGLAHAFLNANNLSPYKIGNFQQYTNGGNTGAPGAVVGVTGGQVPVQELNSLAYAQYLCTIGGDGATSGNFSYCQTLFQLATPPGGMAPTNTLQAMLNIARYPANNASAILTFTLTPIPLSGQTGSQQINAGVYVPALTSTGTAGSGGATDWSVAIAYLTGYGATSTGQGATYPEYVTIDANDDVFFSNPNSSSTAANIIAFTSSGQNLWTSPTDTTTLTNPRAIAADASGHIWVANGGATAATAFMQEMNATSGAVIRVYPSTSSSLYGVAVDSLGNIWYSSEVTTGQNLHELALNGSTYAEATFAVPPSSSATAPTQIRPDSNNNIWINGMSSAGAQSLYFPNTGTAAVPAYAAGLIPVNLPGGSASNGITSDASGNAYSVTNGSGGGVIKTMVTGSGVSAALNAVSKTTNAAAASGFLDIDGAGSIWYLDNASGTSLYQYIPSNGAINSYYPCYSPTTSSSSEQTCTTSLSIKLDLAVDSTGSVWVPSYGNGRIVQIIGLAAPTVPLKALGKPGVMP